MKIFKRSSFKIFIGYLFIVLLIILVTFFFEENNLLLVINNSLILFFILFSDHLKTHFYNIGKKIQGFLGFLSKSDSDAAMSGKDIAIIAKACSKLAASKTGALICLERNDDLSEYKKIGVECNANLSLELLITLFCKESALHDGAAIVHKNTIDFAGCFFPITKKTNLDKQYGSRHRAAIGLTESCDAVIILISEERGTIHFVENGVVSESIFEKDLADKIALYLN
jgi:diadenylate cyclase